MTQGSFTPSFFLKLRGRKKNLKVVPRDIEQDSKVLSNKRKKTKNKSPLLQMMMITMDVGMQLLYQLQQTQLSKYIMCQNTIQHLLRASLVEPLQNLTHPVPTWVQTQELPGNYVFQPDREGCSDTVDSCIREFEVDIESDVVSEERAVESSKTLICDEMEDFQVLSPLVNQRDQNLLEVETFDTSGGTCSEMVASH